MITLFRGSMGVIAGAALLLGACGDRSGEAATNNSSLPTVSANEFTIGNDASAVETVNSNAAERPSILPLGNMSAPPESNGSGGDGAAPVEDSSGKAPGGDRGGNSVQSNVSGM